MAKSYDEKIDKHIPWDGNSQTGGLRVRGTRVEEFIKDALDKKMGLLYYDQSSNRQLIFADDESKNLYLENPIKNAHLVLGSFDAPANYTAEINLISENTITMLKGTKGNYIEFTFDIKNKNGDSVRDSVTCTFTFISANKKQEVRNVYNAGDNVKFFVDDYLTEGNVVVNVSIIGRTTLAATTIGVNYNIIDLELTSSFKFETAKQRTSTLEIPYTVKGAGVKYVEFYLDGIKCETDDTVTDVVGNKIKYIDIVDYTSGKHTLQIRAFVVTNGVRFYSNTIYQEFSIIGEGIVNVLISTVLKSDNIITESLVLETTQYETLSFNFAMYDSKQRALLVKFSVDNAEITAVSTVNNNINTFTYSPREAGNKVINIQCDSYSYDINFNVNESSIKIEEPVDGLLMKLSAKGRSNSDTNRSRWRDRGYKATLKGFAYTEKQGWYKDALVISGGATVETDIKPLLNNLAETGGTIIVDFETSDVDDPNVSICECISDDDTVGFRITPNEAYIKSKGGAFLKTNYRERERLRLAIIINKSTGVENAKTIFIVNNGCHERATNYAVTDTFACDKILKFGNSTGKATIKLYNVSVYNKALSVDEAFNAWALSDDNLQNIIQRNDIFVEGTTTVSPDKVLSRVPVMLITGDMPTLIAARDKKTFIHADVEYINNQDPTKNFIASMMKFYRQGTSSLGYDIPNLNGEKDDKTTMYDFQGNEIDLYSFKKRAQPVGLWCFKADYAESSGSHNTAIARLWNDVMYNTKIDGEYVLRTEAQKQAILEDYPYDVRTTIDGFPIVIFYRINEDSEWICMGQYNFNNDKKTESVFGFEGIPGFDNTNVECWEGLNNTHPIALFTDTSNFNNEWEKAFKGRYPNKSKRVDNLKTLAEWINSTKDNLEKFSIEKYDHFDVWKLGSYYIYLMRFGAVDQPVKNSMLTTEDGVHYFYINYDNDTINGKRNDGPLVYSPFITRQSIDEELNDYAYAGHDSILWNNLEADEDFMNKVKILDNAMFDAGLSYANCIVEFDTNQVDKWCEKLNNLNGEYKYLKPFREKGNNYLYMLQGNLKSHRHWWLSNRFELFDSIWVSGTYKSKAIEFKAQGTPAGSQFSIIAGKNLRYGYGINNDPIEYNVSLNVGESHSFTTLRALAVGDPIKLYGASSINSLYLDSIMQTLTQLNIQSAWDDLLGSKLKHLYLASDTTFNNGYSNTAVDDISGLPKITTLETIDIRGYKAIKTLNLDTLINLKNFYATNSGLTSFTPAKGIALNNLYLPSTIQAIQLDNVKIDNIGYNPNTNLRILNIKNCNFDFKTFVYTWYDALKAAETDLINDAELTIEGIDWDNMTTADLLKLSEFGKYTLKGKITLTSINEEEMEALSAAFGNNVFQPTGEFVIDAPASVFLTGPTTVLSGENAQYKAVVFPVTEGAEFKYQMVGISSTTDSEGNTIYKSGSSTLYEATGKLITVESSSTTSFTLRVRKVGSGTYLDALVSVKGRTYPTKVDIEGPLMIKNTGEQVFNAVYDVENYTGTVTSIEWVLDCDSATAEIANYNDKSCIVLINSVSETTVNATLTLNVSFANGITFNKTYGTIMIGSSLPIMTSGTNPEVMAVMYAAGLANSPDYMTEAEAAAVLDSDLQSGTSYSTSIFYKYGNNTIKTFNEFKYFINVTTVPDYCFYEQRNLTEIEYPDNITYIGIYAFYNTSLKNIIIPKTIEHINSYAFKYSYGNRYRTLENIIFNAESITLGDKVFERLDVQNVLLPKEITKSSTSEIINLCIIDSVTINNQPCKRLFRSCEIVNLTIDIDIDKTCTEVFSIVTVTNLSIGENVTSINNLEFGVSGNLIIPNNVTSIYNSFINQMPSEIIIPDNVINIENSFIRLKGVEEFVIGKNAQFTGTYGQYSRYGAKYPYPNDTKSSFSFAVDEDNPYYSAIDGILFNKSGDTLLRHSKGGEYTVPTSCKHLSSYCFIYSGVTKVTMTSIEEFNVWSIFEGNKTLEELDMEECPLTLIATSDFLSNAAALTSLKLPKTLEWMTSNDGNAMMISNASNLKSLTFPDTLKRIDGVQFYNIGIESVVLPSLTYMRGTTNSGLFSDCKNLTYADLNNIKCAIPERIFFNCSNLETVIISGEDAVKSIQASAFYGCISLKNITIHRQTAPTVYDKTFGNSTGYYTGRNTYNTGENILYVPQGATGYDTSYWLDPLQNAEKCGFTISYTL